MRLARWWDPHGERRRGVKVVGVELVNKYRRLLEEQVHRAIPGAQTPQDDREEIASFGR